MHIPTWNITSRLPNDASSICLLYPSFTLFHKCSLSTAKSSLSICENDQKTTRDLPSSINMIWALRIAILAVCSWALSLLSFTILHVYSLELAWFASWLVWLASPLSLSKSTRIGKYSNLGFILLVYTHSSECYSSHPTAYGFDQSVTQIINRMLNHRRTRGGHPNLII